MNLCKNSRYFSFAAAFAAVCVMVFSGCNSVSGGIPGVKVGGIGVKADPPSATVARGGTKIFTAVVENEEDQSVWWSIPEAEDAGWNPGTRIIPDDAAGGGRLAVALDETHEKFTVRVAAEASPDAHTDIAITVTDVIITGVKITPSAAVVNPGGTLQFSAEVEGTTVNETELDDKVAIPQTVEWSIVESGVKPGTAIGTNGLLTVAAEETLSLLRVKAESIVDEKFAVASVALTKRSVVESDEFTSEEGDNSLVIELRDGTFTDDPEMSAFEISTPGTGGFASLEGGAVGRTDATHVKITGLTAVETAGSGQKITIAAAAQATQASGASVTASRFITDLESGAFTSVAEDNKLTITLKDAKFADTPAPEYFTITTAGTGGFADLTGGTITKISDTHVWITGLAAVPAAGSGQKITIKGAALSERTDGASATVKASRVTGSINLSNGTGTGSGWTYDTGSGVFAILQGSIIEAAGETTSNRISVNSGEGTTLTFNDANIDLSGAADSISPLDLADGAKLTLKLSGTSTLTASGGAAGIHVSAGREITIDSAESTTASPHAVSGTLTATGGGATNGNGGAGLGGNSAEAGGTITITGGTVNAISTSAGAGIGGSDHGDGGTVIISGGVVNATGGNYGAGIGGGFEALNTTGVVRISGGTVNAQGGVYSAGIGGSFSGSGGEITITGGTVFAKAGAGSDYREPAAIGGGNGRSGGKAGTIVISGGTVVAVEGIRSATPYYGAVGDVNSVTISGGTVISGGIGRGTADDLIDFNGSPANAVVLTSAILDSGTYSGSFPSTGALLLGSDVGIAFTGNAATAGTVTLNADLTIPAGATLTIPEGWTLDKNGHTLTGNYTGNVTDSAPPQ